MTVVLVVVRWLALVALFAVCFLAFAACVVILSALGGGVVG